MKVVLNLFHVKLLFTLQIQLFLFNFFTEFFFTEFFSVNFIALFLWPLNILKPMSYKFESINKFNSI
jgi:hypothetical protein